MGKEIDLRKAINALSDVVQNRPRPIRQFDQIYMKTGDMVLQSEFVAAWVLRRQEGGKVGRRDADGSSWNRRQVRGPDDGDDSAGDDVPVQREMDRDHRLNFKQVERASAAIVEGGVVVERHADEVGDRVLGLLGEFSIGVAPRPARFGVRRGLSGETGFEVGRFAQPRGLASDLFRGVFLLASGFTCRGSRRDPACDDRSSEGKELPSP